MGREREQTGMTRGRRERCPRGAGKRLRGRRRGRARGGQQSSEREETKAGPSQPGHQPDLSPIRARPTLAHARRHLQNSPPWELPPPPSRLPPPRRVRRRSSCPCSLLPAQGYTRSPLSASSLSHPAAAAIATREPPAGSGRGPEIGLGRQGHRIDLLLSHSLSPSELARPSGARRSPRERRRRLSQVQPRTL